MIKVKAITNNSYFLLLLEQLLLIEIGAYFIYKIASPITNFIFYGFIFYRFIVSKKIGYWAAFLFIILNNPWGLFYYRPYDWVFSLTPKVGISYMSLFGLVFLVKAIFHFKSRNYNIKDSFVPFYRAIAIYVGFLLIWSFLYGHNLESVFNVFQFVSPLLLFFSVPRLLEKNELFVFNKLIFIFSLIHFIGSLIDIFTSGAFIQLISFGMSRTGAVYEENLIRVVGGITIHLYVIIIGLYYLNSKVSHFKKWYLWLLIILSYVFILNSATRGWMIAASFLLFGYIIRSLFKGKISVKSIAGIIITLLLFRLIVPDSLKDNLVAAFDRLETVEALAEGDVSAGGTLSRLTERAPRVMTRFDESPIFGFGYSKVSAEYYDGHVGNHCLLLMGGVVGLVAIWLTAIFLIFYFFRIDSRLPSKGFFVFGLALLTIMIIHSTSRVMVSFYMTADSAFLIALLFNHFNAEVGYYLKK